jgi:hypothetical protein
MRVVLQAILVVVVCACVACSSNDDNAHTTATTIVPPPPRQNLHVERRPGRQTLLPPSDQNPSFNPKNPYLVLNLPNGKTLRANEEVVLDFFVANAKLKGDGGDFRLRYIVDDDEMQWIDRWEQIVLTGWQPGKHTIRVELVGPDGWPYRNGDYNVTTREINVTP